MKICIGSDHGGYALKLELIEHLKARGFEVTDVGCDSDKSCDYPVYAKAVTDIITEKKADLGILVCGTGIGMSIAANKVKGIRAACCSEQFSARLTREHNNANVLCFGARVVGEGTALDLVDAFVDTPYSNDERHQRRIDLITDIEK